MNLACGEQFATRYYTSKYGWQAMMAWYEERLARFVVDVQSHIIPTRYGCTHVLMAGDENAPPIILLHGTNVSALGWQAQIEELSRDYWVIAPDIIGYAGKSDAVRLSYRGFAYAQWLEDVLNALCIDRVVLVGSSGGGYFALQAGGYLHQRIAGIALINPCGIVPFKFPLNWLRQPPFAYSVRFLAQQLLPARWLASRLAKKNVAPHATPSQDNIQLAYLLLKHYIRHHPPGVLPMKFLQKLTLPILLLVSEQEPFLPVMRLINRAKDLFPCLDAHLIPNAGHDSHVEQPHIVNCHLRTFLASLL